MAAGDVACRLRVAHMGTLAGCRAQPWFVGPARTRAAGRAAGEVPALLGGPCGGRREQSMGLGRSCPRLSGACMWQGVTGGHATALAMLAAAAVVAVVAAAARVFTWLFLKAAGLAVP